MEMVNAENRFRYYVCKEDKENKETKGQWSCIQTNAAVALLLLPQPADGFRFVAVEKWIPKVCDTLFIKAALRPVNTLTFEIKE
jgi:hypothetical protein